MFDSGATVFFAIFMAFWGKSHCVSMTGSISSDYPFFTFLYLPRNMQNHVCFCQQFSYMWQFRVEIEHYSVT